MTARSISQKVSLRWCGLVWILLLQLGVSRGQGIPVEVEDMGYADTIFVNGKVASMDDASSSTSPGHIYQAVAVKRSLHQHFPAPVHGQ